ncbi:MAG: hypothetical protein JOZ57_07300, partial [Abitibacteriaceae bacterium]|nr:hypothetical protein [Abditibacteriaceae bacterium]
LPDEASFDEVGIASAQLAGYLIEDEAPAPPPPPHAVHPPQPPHPFGGKNVHVNIGNMPDLQELRGLGQKIREQVMEQVMRDRDHIMRQCIPGWGQAEDRAPEAHHHENEAHHPPHPPHPPQPPIPPQPPMPPHAGPANAPDTAEVAARIESEHRSISQQLHAVAEQLRRSDLNDAQRVELADQLGQLSQEQARLSQEWAEVRAAGEPSQQAKDKNKDTQRLV